jgi:hypothetical protein
MGVPEFQHSTPPLPVLPPVMPMNGSAHPVPGPTGLPVFPSPIYTNFSGNEATQGGDSLSPRSGRDTAEGNYFQHQQQQVPPNYPGSYPPVMSNSAPHTPVASGPGYQYVPPLSVVPMHSHGASISWAQHPQQLPPPHHQQHQQIGTGYPYFPTPSPPLPQAIPLAMVGAVGFPPVNPGEMPYQQFGMYPGGLPPPYLPHNGYNVNQGQQQAPPFAYYPMGPSPSSSPSHSASQGNNVHYSNQGYSYSTPPVNGINHVDYEQQQVYPNHQPMPQRNYQHRGGGRGQVDHTSNHSRANHTGAYPRGPNPNSPRRSGEQQQQPKIN